MWPKNNKLKQGLAPAQRLKSGYDGEGPGSRPLDHPGQEPVTRPWTISSVEINCHIETEVSETRGARVQYMCTDQQADRESSALAWITFMGISSASSLTCHLAFLGLHLCLVCLSAVPCVRSSLSQDGWGRGPQLHHSVEWCRPLFVSSFVVGKVSLMPRMRKVWSLSLLDRAQLPLLLFWSLYPQRRKCSTGGPSISCLSSFGLRSSLVLIHFIQDSTFYSPNWSPACFQRKSEVHMVTWNPKE